MKKTIVLAIALWIFSATFALAIPWSPGPTGGHVVGYARDRHQPVKVYVIPVSTVHVSYKTVRVMSFRFNGGCLQWVKSTTLFTYTETTIGETVERTEAVTDLGEEVLTEFCF